MFLAFDEASFAGYVTLVWRPDYRPFAAAGMREIQDLNVIPRHRRRGVATALDRAEAAAGARSRVVGIGVGLGADYGPAQRLYALSGYIPDGLGVAHQNEGVLPGQVVAVDDELVLHLTKAVGENAPPD